MGSDANRKEGQKINDRKNLMMRTNVMPPNCKNSCRHGRIHQNVREQKIDVCVTKWSLAIDAITLTILPPILFSIRDELDHCLGVQ